MDQKSSPGDYLKLKHLGISEIRKSGRQRVATSGIVKPRSPKFYFSVVNGKAIGPKGCKEKKSPVG